MGSSQLRKYAVAGMLTLKAGSAATLSVHINANSPGQRGGTLRDNIKKTLRNLVRGQHVRTAKVEIDVEGKKQPIDLLADRVKAKCLVEMDGRYPKADTMFEALEIARKEVAGELAQHFGPDDKALD
jgi:hypothetical protein